MTHTPCRINFFVANSKIIRQNFQLEELLDFFHHRGTEPQRGERTGEEKRIEKRYANLHICLSSSLSLSFFSVSLCLCGENLSNQLVQQQRTRRLHRLLKDCYAIAYKMKGL